ncbi:MAG: hypothetical protein JWM74_4785 [Myxococcaceae bacterium]|nr:hypothetical protein [Myxococcaceae bacterium]
MELFVSDLALARALHATVPAARLLARAQLARDTQDLTAWNALLVQLAGGPGREADGLLHAVARHLRVAITEGPLVAHDSVVAVLVLAVSADLATERAEAHDASLAELTARPEPLACDEGVVHACGLYEPRITAANLARTPSTSPLRFALFDACVRLAATSSIGPWSAARLADLVEQLASTELGVAWRTGGHMPDNLEAERSDRHLAIVERGPLDALVARDPRELASAIARLQRAPKGGASRVPLDSFLADLTHLLKRRGSLVVAMKELDPDGQPLPTSPPSERPSSIPVDWTQPTVAPNLADSFERGQVPSSRVRNLVARGGEPALDAIGAEMLRVPLHPNASATFAEILARSGRPRDVIRLVTYFAIAPDPQLAARALSACSAPELPAVLRGWLEAMLPSDGQLAPFGDDPYTSSTARLTACVASLAPYPRLYKAVHPLLLRVSERPAPSPSGISAD